MQERLEIEKMINGGYGLGRRADGAVVMVPFVLPGEEVVVRCRRSRGTLMADLVKILRPAAERVPPPCPVFGRCGGCRLQHAGYEAQVRIKEKILAETLGRALGQEVIDTVMEPLQGAPEPWGYRQRVRFQVDEMGRTGFHAARSHEVVGVDRCLLAAPAISSVQEELAARGDYHDLLRHAAAVELRHDPAGGNVHLLLHLRRRARPADRRRATELAAAVAGLASITLHAKGAAMEGPFGGPAHLGFSLELPGQPQLRYRFETSGFCQVNLSQNQRLAATLLDWAAPLAGKTVLDLFCGMGNFSLPLSRQAARVVGADQQRAAIRAAAKNAAANHIGNIRFLRDDGAGALAATGRESFDLLVLDPPRQGCREVIRALGDNAPATIIYISCDPATLGRDLGLLTGKGYTVSRLQGFDMFPQTHHIETMALLQK